MPTLSLSLICTFAITYLQGLNDVLESEEGPFTLFAPTNEALIKAGAAVSQL